MTPAESLPATRELLTTAQVANYHHTTTSTVQRWVNAGLLVPAHPGGQGKGAALFTQVAVQSFAPPPKGRRKTRPVGPSPSEINDALTTMTDEVCGWYEEDYQMLLRMARHHGLILPGQSSHWERGQIFEVLEKLVQARLTPRDQHTFYVELASVRFARCLGYRSDRIARDLGLNVTLVNWYRGDWEASTPYEPAPVRHIADAEGIAARVQKAYPEERWTAQWEAGAYKADPEAVKAAQLRHKTLSPAHIAAIQQLETQRAYDEELSALANGSKPSRTGYRRPTER